VSVGLLNNHSPFLSVFLLLHPLLYLHYFQYYHYYYYYHHHHLLLGAVFRL
jgi:hypothetical protein